MLGVETYQPNLEAQKFSSLTPVPASFAVAPNAAAFSFPRGMEALYGQHPVPGLGLPVQWTAAAMSIPAHAHEAAVAPHGESERRESPPLHHYGEESPVSLASTPDASAATVGLYDPAPVSPPPARERFSYTRYQLEVLNGIYGKIRYPNRMQKHLTAKRVGITPDQVKIWFQNRRRKDIVAATKGGKAVKEEIRPGKRMVTDGVLNGVLGELLKYQHDPKGKKLRETLGGTKNRRAAQKTPSPPLPSPAMESEDSLSPRYSLSPSKYQPNGSMPASFNPAQALQAMSGQGYEEIHMHGQHPGLMTLAFPPSQQTVNMVPNPLDAVASNPEMTSSPEVIASVSPNPSPAEASPVSSLSGSTVAEQSPIAAAVASADATSPPNVTIGPNMEVIVPAKDPATARRREMKQSPIYGAGSQETADSVNNEGGSHPNSPLSDTGGDFMPPNTVAPPSEPFHFQAIAQNPILAPGPSAPVMHSPISHLDESHHSHDSSDSAASTAVAPKTEYVDTEASNFGFADSDGTSSSSTHVGFVQDEAHLQIPGSLPGVGESKTLNPDRVFPFQLMAEPPAILSSLPAYHHDPYGAAAASGVTYQTHSMPYRDPYQPLMIQTYGNPYYGYEMTSRGEQDPNMTRL